MFEFFSNIDPFFFSFVRNKDFIFLVINSNIEQNIPHQFWKDPLSLQKCNSHVKGENILMVFSQAALNKLEVENSHIAREFLNGTWTWEDIVSD